MVAEIEGKNLKLGKRKAEAVQGEEAAAEAAGKEELVIRTLLYG